MKHGNFMATVLFVPAINDGSKANPIFCILMSNKVGFKGNGSHFYHSRL
jgi:hypothetical protein